LRLPSPLQRITKQGRHKRLRTFFLAFKTSLHKPPFYRKICPRRFISHANCRITLQAHNSKLRLVNCRGASIHGICAHGENQSQFAHHAYNGRPPWQKERRSEEHTSE